MLRIWSNYFMIYIQAEQDSKYENIFTFYHFAYVVPQAP